MKAYFDRIAQEVKKRAAAIEVALMALMIMLMVSGVAQATDDIDFSAVVTSILLYIGAAFTAVTGLLAIMYGAPLAWRFLKKFK